MAWIVIPVVASASGDSRSPHQPLLVQHASTEEALARDGRRLRGMIERAKAIMEDMLVQLKMEATPLEAFARRQQLQQALLKLQVETENAELALTSLHAPFPDVARGSRPDLDRTMQDLHKAYGVAESLMADLPDSPTAH